MKKSPHLKEPNLSDKIFSAIAMQNIRVNSILARDVRQAIMEIKSLVNKNQNITCRQKVNIRKGIKEIVGEKLI